MIREVMDEANQIAREMPGFTIIFLVLTILCIGVRCTVFLEADSERLMLAQNSMQDGAMEGGGHAMARMQARAAGPLRTPGFTVIVGLRQYEMELSVPAASVHSLLENARMNVVSLAHGQDPRN